MKTLNEAELKAQFEQQGPRFLGVEQEAKFILEGSVREKEIKTHSIQTRIKEFGSFLDKVKRKETDTPFDNITDIVGLRVVCLFLSDIPRVGDLIREKFDVVSEDDKIQGAEVSSFGYMSIHYIAKMRKEYKGPRYDKIAGMPFEIQVRTILMDAWSNVSHYLDYKSDIDVPTSLRRDFYALSGLFYIADSHFELFFKSSKLSQAQMVELAAESKPKLAEQEINFDTLTAYLRSRLPEREHSDPVSISELVQELRTCGYKTIQEVDSIVERTSDAFRAYEGDHPPSQKPHRFTDVGVVRVSFGIVDDKFNEMRSGSGKPVDMDEYKKLVK
jgi:putative GTP pyrophosphokinase